MSTLKFFIQFSAPMSYSDKKAYKYVLLLYMLFLYDFMYIFELSWFYILLFT